MIDDYYAGKTLLITGATGFLGILDFGFSFLIRKGVVGESDAFFAASSMYLFRHQRKGKSTLRH